MFKTSIAITIALLYCSLAPGCTTLRNPGLSSLERQAAAAYAAGRSSEAEALYGEWLQRHPGTGEPWFLLGNIYAESGRLEEAERAYRTALKQGADPRILHNLGLVQVRMGIQALRTARRQLPTADPIRQETRRYMQTLLEEIP